MADKFQATFHGANSIPQPPPPRPYPYSASEWKVWRKRVKVETPIFLAVLDSKKHGPRPDIARRTEPFPY